MRKPDNNDELAGVVHELRKLPEETEWVEFKRNNTDPDDIGEYISALANAATLCGQDKGYVVWGVDDSTHEVVGTSFRPKQFKQGNEELENWLIRLLSPRIHFRFKECTIGGESVAVLEVPRADHRPVQFKGTEFIRIGSYKKPLKDYPEKERELWRLFDTTPFELQVVVDRLDAGDVLALLDYPAYFQLLEIPLPETRHGILERLAEDRMIQSRQGGKWDILNLGAILFATELKNFPRLGRKAVRVIDYEGVGRVKTRREYQGNKGYANGFEGLIGFLKGMLPENEVIGQALRKNVPMYPEIAIRELVANLIIHQDFTVGGAGPMVEIFDGRIEITNPGVPLMDTKRFLDSPPRSRNEALASFLRRVGICEERGSGIDKVVFQTEFYQLPAPLFEVAGGHTRAVLFAHTSFGDMDKADRIRACYLHACLQCVQHERMTNSTLRARFGVEEQNRAQISRVIGDTMDAGLVRPYNPESESRRHASYVPFWA